MGSEMCIRDSFDIYQPDVANIIPPQQAGDIAHRAGVTDSSGWCPVESVSFESNRQPNIHVIGDAAIAAPMPKSAFAANSQAKVCAIALVRLFRGIRPEPTVLANTCYSYLSPVTRFPSPVPIEPTTVNFPRLLRPAEPVPSMLPKRCDSKRPPTRQIGLAP